MKKHQEYTLFNIILIVLLGCCSLIQTAFASESSLVLPTQTNSPISLHVSKNLSLIDAEKLLKVYVGNVEIYGEDQPPIAGKYSVTESGIHFTPQFEWVAGQYYFVQYKMKLADTGYLTKPFILQKDIEKQPAQVTAIYPSGDFLPENTLRFYIHFSQPMQPHVAKEYIKLTDKDGNSDDAAFMHFKQELWSHDRKRLTILMDPGRIKRLVATNKTLGPALISGKKYSLSVAKGWPTANGNSNLATFSKTFIIVEALRSIPTIKQWQIDKPVYKSKNPITIKFDRLFDFHQLHNSIAVTTNTGELIKGKIVVSRTGEKWQFYPEQRWITNKLKIRVHPTLEDVAGNNFKDLLDHSVGIQTTQVNSINIDMSLN